MKTVLNVKTDKDIKQRAQRLAEHLGIPLSTVVNAYLKEFVHAGGISMHRESQLKKSVRDAIVRARQEAQKNKNISPAFSDAKQALLWLKK